MEITSSNIVRLILDNFTRENLFKAIALENGNKPIIINQVSDAIRSLESIAESDIVRIEHILLNEGYEGERILEDFVSHQDFPESLLYELLDLDKCLMALCHRRQPINFLLKLIEKHDDAWEAIITVGQYYYFQADISVSQFINYIDKYKYSSWLLSNLFHCLDGENPKTQHYLDFIATTEYGAELLQKQRALELEREFLTELETTTNIKFIKEKATTKNSEILRAIACNNCTPIELLTELSTMKEVKYARQIRINALETLRRKK